MPGTVLLLAAAPAGKGCLVDAASVLPILAAVPPTVLSGTDTANVVELADPLEPQAVLTRLRAAAAVPAPLTLFVTGQLHLDRRQHLPHLALARTTAATVRYTGFPWHWIREELRLRAPGSTTLLLDLHADAETWQWLRANPLDSGRNSAVYGRIAPPPSRRTLAGPTYMKAVATLLRSGHRPPLDQLHQQALARISPDGGMSTDIVLTAQGPAQIPPPHIVAEPPVHLRPHSSVQIPPQAAAQTPPHLPPESPAPIPEAIPAQALPPESPAQTRAQDPEPIPTQQPPLPPEGAVPVPGGVSAEVLPPEGPAVTRAPGAVPVPMRQASLPLEGAVPVPGGVSAEVLPPEGPAVTRAPGPEPVPTQQAPLPREGAASISAGAAAQVLPPESSASAPAQVSSQESSECAVPVAAAASAQVLPQQASEGPAPVAGHGPAQVPAQQSPDGSAPTPAGTPARALPPQSPESPAATPTQDPAQVSTRQPEQGPAPSPVQSPAPTPAPTPAQNLAPTPAQSIPPMPAYSPAPPTPAQLPALSAVPRTDRTPAHPPTPTDPHAVIAAAAEAGRHSEAEALAAHHEQVALRAHGPASEEALHWIEVRADLAMLAGDAVRSCRTWLTVASARLSAGQAPDAPAVEAAVDRAHHQWGQIKDAAPARELGPVLAELRGRVPGRRRGALENVLQQLRQLQVSG